MSYHRVIPRDLFNEAKLLKSLGRLALLLHEGRAFARFPTLELEHFPDDDAHPGFEIDLDGENNALVCLNVNLYDGERHIPLSSAYNSKERYPLYFGEVEGFVFDDEGNPSAEFLAYLDKLKEGS